jgi:hypothetical protein
MISSLIKMKLFFYVNFSFCRYPHLRAEIDETLRVQQQVQFLEGLHGLKKS